MLEGEGTSGAKVLGKARGKGTRQGAKDSYDECLKLEKCGGLGGGSVVMELLLCK